MAALLMLLTLAGCEDPLNSGGGGNNNNNNNGGGNHTPTPEITIGTDVDLTPSVAAEGGDINVSFTASADWTASVTETKAVDWISVEPTSGKAGNVKVTVTVKANEGSEAREAELALVSGTVKKTIQIKQGPGKLSDEDWFSVNFWDRTDLQKNGLRGPVKTLQTHYEGASLYTFNQQGNLLSKLRSDNVRVDNEYDAQGRRISSTYTSEDGYVGQKNEYVYDNGDRLVAMSDFWLAYSVDLSEYGGVPDYWDNGAFIRGLSEYHEDWIDPLEVHCHDSYYSFGEDGNLTIELRTYRINTYQYEEKGRDGEHLFEEVEKSVIVYENGLPVSTRDGQMRFSWQENGMPARFDSRIPETTYTWLGDQVVEATWVKNDFKMVMDYYKVPQGYAGAYASVNWMQKRFNEHMDLIQSDHMNGYTYTEDGYVINDYYEDYVYDSHGNWISRVKDIEPTLSGGRSKSTERRTITYY
ncbi:MAG: BACON domain-containing protein [Bacteroidales bacterium]|jgi:hypothetical protein|nr:BACON domain-containing protein [Bacteroidales bacterium]